uniref:PEST proteolytic signal-containing nuclear protein n=1 Tax=Panagrellus redivivus TaxID=6233 RepID=A0A7E4ZR96_PANRE
MPAMPKVSGAAPQGREKQVVPKKKKDTRVVSPTFDTKLTLLICRTRNETIGHTSETNETDDDDPTPPSALPVPRDGFHFGIRSIGGVEYDSEFCKTDKATDLDEKAILTQVVPKKKKDLGLDTKRDVGPTFETDESDDDDPTPPSALPVPRDGFHFGIRSIGGVESIPMDSALPIVF